MSKRFRYYRNSQMIVDNLTGERYSGNKKTCDLLNILNDRADHKQELLDPFLQVMRKYEIDSIGKLDRILFERGVW